MRRLLLLAALSLSPSHLAGKAMLIGGSPADLKAFPEVVYYTAGRAACSGTIIGPSVVLTAAHCVNNGQVISEYRGKWKAVCKRHPSYTASSDYYAVDMAVCQKLDGHFNVQPASIADQGPEVDESVTLAGYGCVRSDGKGGNDGILRVGKAPVIDLPVSGSQEYWFYTQGDAALCFGDSGGPSFKYLEDPEMEEHVILGVNSRGNIKDLSMLTAVYLDIARQFLLDFAKLHRVKICGVTADC